MSAVILQCECNYVYVLGSSRAREKGDDNYVHSSWGALHSQCTNQICRCNEHRRQCVRQNITIHRKAYAKFLIICFISILQVTSLPNTTNSFEQPIGIVTPDGTPTVQGENTTITRI